jgi:hypothetical protein
MYYRDQDKSVAKSVLSNSGPMSPIQKLRLDGVCSVSCSITFSVCNMLNAHMIFRISMPWKGKYVETRCFLALRWMKLALINGV